jgi:cytochrome P450
MAGATDTSAVTNEWAMAEVIRNPAIQRKIQDEIDLVVGKDRLVGEEDLYKLPYLMCVVKETFRLHPAGPFSIPRMSMKDTKLMGYDIPKGTRVLINIHSLGRSKETWVQPLMFRPERWTCPRFRTPSSESCRLGMEGGGAPGRIWEPQWCSWSSPASCMASPGLCRPASRPRALTWKKLTGSPLH